MLIINLFPKILINRKHYKTQLGYYINIIPGDPRGLPDAFYNGTNNRIY